MMNANNNPSPHEQKLRSAVRHHESGRLPQAETLYREILAQDPRQVDALHLLGVLCGQTGREADAVTLIKQAISLGPAVARQHNNLGNVLRQMGRRPDAIASFRSALELDPSYAPAWNNLGNALVDDGQTAAGMDAYRRSLQIQPENPQVYSNLGVALRASGQLEEAIATHRHAIALAPESSEAHNNLGASLRDAGRARDSLAAHERAVQLRPDSLSALTNLGAALRNVKRVDEAIETLRGALSLNQNFADAHNNLGSALIDRGEFESAAQSCRRALALRPGYADAHGNLAIALAYLGAVDEALTHARLAVQMTPAQPLAHWNLSMLLLLLGDFERGWKEHEWRWKCPSMLKNRQFAEPRWDGEALEGQTVLLFAEQGFGDMLQFIRFAPLIAQCGGRAVVECQPELIRLFERVPGVAAVTRSGEPLTKFDLQCPLMSVPYALRGKRFSPPPVPYLSGCDQERLQAETERLRWRIDAGKLNVGLVWAGDSAHQNDRARSVALSQFSPLAEIAGVLFHSLQKGPAASDANSPPPGVHVIDHAAQMTDFADTSDLIESLDLIITVDTAVAHLAGAMGKPTFVLLPFMPDWRWMLHRPDVDWYPTLRLFRQPILNDWNSAVRNVARALRDRLSIAGLRPNSKSSMVSLPAEGRRSKAF